MAKDQRGVPAASAIGPDMAGEIVPPIPVSMPINPNSAGAMNDSTRSSTIVLVSYCQDGNKQDGDKQDGNKKLPSFLRSTTSPTSVHPMWDTEWMVILGRSDWRPDTHESQLDDDPSSQ